MSINMLLGKQLGIYTSNMVNHLTGIAGSGIIFIFALMLGMSKGVELGGIPAYAFLGGVMGSTFVVLSNYSFSKTSVVTSTILILCGQFISSILIDVYILNMQIKTTSIIGALLIIIGTIMYNMKGKEKAS